MSPALASVVRIGTRRSALARAQTAGVVEVLRAAGFGVELVPVVTTGDRSRQPLEQLGGTGVFVSELRARLLAGDIDVAVHSLKDLPTRAEPGIALAAVPGRADPRDALVARDGRCLADLPVGATVGTGSPRRAAQLRRRRLDLRIVPIRGNVDTRLRRVTEGAIDAVVLAVAGLERLGRRDAATEVFEPGQVLPAPGQGALAIECRAADPALAADLAARLDDPATRAAVTAERGVLARLETGCTAPVAAYAEVTAGRLTLSAAVIAADGSGEIRMTDSAPVAAAGNLGPALAERLLEAGAARLIGDL